MIRLGITLAIASDRLNDYLAAERRVLDNQEYEIEGRKLTRADLKDVRDGIVFWQGQVTALGGAAPPRARGRMRSGSYRSR